MEATFAWILRNVGQIVDVLAVAILFYYILIYARGTKVMLVVQGILVMSGFYFLCQYLKLITLVFIMDAVFTVGPLAIFILFVPEIRKVLVGPVEVAVPLTSCHEPPARRQRADHLMLRWCLTVT